MAGVTSINNNKLELTVSLPDPLIAVSHVLSDIAAAIVTLASALQP